MNPENPDADRVAANGLDDRIAKARASGERHRPSLDDGGDDPGIESAMSFGMRAGAQFVSAVVLGGGLGWAIDRWLGTRPFGMLILMVLSFIAAMANVWRSMSKAVDVATETALAAEKSGAAEKSAASGDRVTEEIDGKSS
ncbi:MAG: synthase assembly protein [Rhodospirillales bacterium]|nr:synthase assembly protein [Rhodospirillales bacterium]